MSNKEKTFEKIKELLSKKNPRLNKKAKILAMRHNIKLGDLRKEFCQNCFFPLEKAKRRIKKNFLIVHCANCRKVSRWKIKTS